MDPMHDIPPRPPASVLDHDEHEHEQVAASYNNLLSCPSFTLHPDASLPPGRPYLTMSAPPPPPNTLPLEPADTPPDIVVIPRHLVGHAHYMGLAGSALRTAIGLAAGLCFLSFGYGQGDIGGFMVIRSFRDEFPEMDAATYPTLHVAVIAGAVVATWNLGCFAGAIVTIFMGDWAGRKKTIILGLCLMLAGKLVQVTTFSFGQYIVGRFLSGFGNGFIASTVPAWQAECLKTHRRGTLLLVSFGTCITAGLTLAYWVDYAFSWVQPSSASWRVPIAFIIIFLLVALLLVVFLPESPRWLILTGREDEAKKVLSALSELPQEDEDVRREFLMIKNTLIHISSGGVGQTFSQGQYRYLHRTLLAVFLQVMQQATGVNLFMQYLGSMFLNQLKFPAQLSLLLAACCATEFFLSSLVAVFGIDRYWGRRTLTMFGAAGMCLCMIILSFCAYIGTQKAHYAMAAFLFLYNSFFTVGWQGMSWLWAVELIPLRIRGPANALSTAANWLANFVIVLATPALFTNTTYRTYIVFAVTNFCIIPIIYFFYPETGFRSLEEVDVLFSEAAKVSERPGQAYFSVVRIARTEPLWYDKNGEKTTDDSEAGRSSGLKKRPLTDGALEGTTEAESGSPEHDSDRQKSEY